VYTLLRETKPVCKMLPINNTSKPTSGAHPAFYSMGTATVSHG